MDPHADAQRGAVQRAFHLERRTRRRRRRRR
jgi:hypothetical protein